MNIVRRLVFYREHARSRLDDFKKFMFEQSQPFPESLDFIKKLARSLKPKKYPMSLRLNNESRELNEYRIQYFSAARLFRVFFQLLLPGIAQAQCRNL